MLNTLNLYPNSTTLTEVYFRVKQGTCLLSGAALSLLLTRKIGARPWLRLAPQCVAILGFTAQLWVLLLP